MLMTLIVAGVTLPLLLSACAKTPEGTLPPQPLNKQARSEFVQVAYSSAPLATSPHMRATVSGLATDAILVVAFWPVFAEERVSQEPIPPSGFVVVPGDYVAARVGVGQREVSLDLNPAYFRTARSRGNVVKWHITALLVRDLRARAVVPVKKVGPLVSVRPADVPESAATLFVQGPDSDSKSDSLVGSRGRFFEVEGLDSGSQRTYYASDEVLDKLQFSTP
jgi:hypothetical protein